jgi:hypothetical protein
VNAEVAWKLNKVENEVANGKTMVVICLSIYVRFACLQGDKRIGPEAAL